MKRTKKYFLWRFMMGKRQQGKGYGRAAMEKMIEILRGKPQEPAGFMPSLALKRRAR